MKLSQIMSQQMRATCQIYHDVISSIIQDAAKQGIIVTVEVTRKPTDTNAYRTVTARPCRSLYTQLSDQEKLEENGYEPGR